MTNEEMNKYVAKKLGLCWHEWTCPGGACTCGSMNRYHQPENNNPDFSTDAGTVQLLRLIMEMKGFNRLYMDFLCGGNMWIPTVKFLKIFTTPGVLLKAVYDYFKEGEK
jgi:hypothetical protein